MNIFDKKSEYYLLSVAIVVFSLLIIEMVCFVCSRGIPYLCNQDKVLGWFYFIFPPTLIFFIYFTFFHKWKATGQNGLQVQYSKEELASPYFKAKKVLFSSPMVVIFSTFLAWMTWSIPACAAYLYSNQHVTKEFTIKNLKSADSRGVDIVFDKTDGIEYSLRQPGHLELGVPWNMGDKVCVRGRTSFLGTIVEDFKRGAC